MAWTNRKGFNFRDTAGYVTDGTNEEDVSVAKGGGTASYPYSETIDGDTFNVGWVSGMGNFRDRNASNDRRLAGVNFATNGTDSDANRAFIIVVPSAGYYEISLALGDDSADDQYWKIFDDATLIETFGPVATGANQWCDANGTLHTSSANWAANNTTRLYYLTTSLKIRIGHGATGVATRLAHLAIRKVDPPKVPKPDFLLVFNQASGAAITGYGSVASGGYTIQQGTSPTDYEWGAQPLSPTAGRIDLKNIGNGSSNMPYMTTAATSPSAAMEHCKFAVAFEVDGWDTGLGSSHVITGSAGSVNCPVGVRVVPPSGGGDFDIALHTLTSGGFGFSNLRTGMTGLTFGTLYKLVGTIGPTGSGTLALKYKLNSNAVQAPTPVSDGADAFHGSWPLLNGAIPSGFTDFGGLNGRLYYYAHDRGGAAWLDAELRAINEDPSAALTGWPSGPSPLLSIGGNSAEVGSLNNTNVENTSGGPRFTGGVIMPTSGILKNLYVYLSGFNPSGRVRFAIYQGGAANDPTGATLVWDSGQIVETNGTVGWRDMITYGLSPSGLLPNGARIWVVFKETDCSIRLSNTDAGGWTTSPGSEGSTIGNDTTVAFASTWPTDPGSASAEAIKARIEYTAPTMLFSLASKLLRIG